LIVVVALLYLAALVLSRRRPRMTVIIGVVLAANALLVLLALSVGRQLFVTSWPARVWSSEHGVLRPVAVLPAARSAGVALARF
jgi:hypothetical protein